MAHPQNSGSALTIFLKFCRMKGANRYMKILCFFSRKNFIWGNLIFLDHFLLFDWAWSKLSQVTLTIGFLNSQDMISFMITSGSLNRKTWLGYLSSQDMIFQVNVYVMDIVWILCDVYMWRSKFNRGSYGFVKL